MTNYEISREERTQSARRLFGHAIKHDPYEAFDAMGSPLASRLSGRATNFVVSSAREERGEEFHTDVVDLLRYGIEDTQNVLHEHLARITYAKGVEQAETFATHGLTTEAIAILALRTEESMRSLISAHERDTNGSYFRVVGEDEALEAVPYRVSPNEKAGCPFAGHDGQVEIDPLFKRFADWTGKLCIASIANNLKRQS